MAKQLVDDYQLDETEIRFFMGYSGWTPSQLDDELNENSWIIAEKCSPGTVFTNTEQNMWKQVVLSLGQRFAHIANFPENPQLN